MAARPNPKDFMFSRLSGETCVKEPGAINGYDFVIEDLDNCTVYLLDHMAQVTADMCKNCILHIGPVEGSVFLRDCSDCIVTAACGQFRTKNCSNLRVFLFSNSDPSIEYSTTLYFAPYSMKYPLQDSHFLKAGLDIGSDKWSQVFDFNAEDNVKHWALLPPQEFQEFIYQRPELGEPVNPVPRHASYGGALTHSLLIGSQKQEISGMQSFGFDALQKDAEKVMQTNSAPQYDDFFGDSTAYNPPAGGYSPPSVDFGFSAGNQANDPFGQPQAIPIVLGGEEEVDQEEIELHRLREIENQDRMRKLEDKDREERRLKEEKRKSSREELQKWYNDRAKILEQKKIYNREQEKDYMLKKEEFRMGNPWKKVGSMVDFKETTEKKAVNRMRQVLLAKKNES
jgi:protein XRP2